jgi:Protein of unknown function (DUF2510)
MAVTDTAQGTRVEAWEYAIFQGNKDIIATVNDLDVEGWHLVNIISAADRGFAAIVRRAIDPLPPLSPGTPPGWYPDPSPRPHEVRFWNGMAWTHNVGRGSEHGRDAPTRRPPTPGLTQP